MTTRYIHMMLVFIISLFLINCSPHAFNSSVQSSKITPVDIDERDGEEDETSGPAPADDSNNGNNSGGNISTPNDSSNPGNPGVPVPPPYKVTRCDLLIDKTGVYFNLGTQSNYIAVTGVTECAYNEINHIEGECSEDPNLTILRPEDIDGINNSDLAVDRDHAVTIEPGDNAMFVCLSLSGTLIISAPMGKIILVDK